MVVDQTPPLGDIDVKRVPIDDTVASPAKYCHSLQSLGAVVPDATKAMDVGGVKWHLGPLAEEQAKLDDAEGLGGQQHYNQFVVHDESQYCLRFMVQVEFGGMKARTVPSSTTTTDSAAAKPEAGSSGPRVTFADDLPLDMDDVDLEVEEPEAPGAAAASQPPETEPSQPLEMYSMTQDGPEYRSAQNVLFPRCSGVLPCLTPARAVGDPVKSKTSQEARTTHHRRESRRRTLQWIHLSRLQMAQRRRRRRGLSRCSRRRRRANRASRRRWLRSAWRKSR